MIQRKDFPKKQIIVSNQDVIAFISNQNKLCLLSKFSTEWSLEVFKTDVLFDDCVYLKNLRIILCKSKTYLYRIPLIESEKETIKFGNNIDLIFENLNTMPINLRGNEILISTYSEIMIWELEKNSFNTLIDSFPEFICKENEQIVHIKSNNLNHLFYRNKSHQLIELFEQNGNWKKKNLSRLVGYDDIQSNLICFNNPKGAFVNLNFIVVNL